MRHHLNPGLLALRGFASAGRVLTMERLHGAPLTDLAAIRGVTGQDPERILINALNTWFGSVLACPSFHADVHAGARASLACFSGARQCARFAGILQWCTPVRARRRCLHQCMSACVGVAASRLARHHQVSGVVAMVCLISCTGSGCGCCACARALSHSGAAMPS